MGGVLFLGGVAIGVAVDWFFINTGWYKTLYIAGVSGYHLLFILIAGYLCWALVKAQWYWRLFLAGSLLAVFMTLEDFLYMMVYAVSKSIIWPFPYDYSWLAKTYGELFYIMTGKASYLGLPQGYYLAFLFLILAWSAYGINKSRFPAALLAGITR